ncbi:hypothetical protein BJY00DRAFT_312147 [Aspergillus carlsbadensis]|nr:hypothetical protein BJY00DRAFT_312147 [Aspergillus carlsbadensis]
MLNDTQDPGKIRRFFLNLYRLSRRHKETSASLLEGQDLQIEIEHPLLSFCKIRRRCKPNSKIWHASPVALPAHFDILLADYSLALSPTNVATVNNSVPARSRIDAILHLLLAHAKKRLLDSSAEDTNTTSKLDTLYWDYEQFVSPSRTLGAQRREKIPICALDYALWYGDARDFETNFVVVRARKMIVDGGGRQFLPILTAMSLIQYNRVKRKVNKEVYGIFTDGVTWVFFHLDKWKRLSYLRLSWTDGQQQTVINLISKILDDAVRLSLLSNKPKLSWVDSESGLSPWNVRQWDYAKGEEDEGQGFTPGDMFNLEYETYGDGFWREDDYWRVDASEECKMPDHLKSVLEDYKLAFGETEQTEPLLRVKVETVLFVLLAFIKKRDYSTDSVGPSDSLHWQLDVPFTYMPVLDKRVSKTITPSGDIGHVLFYGSPEKVETNLIVVITKCPNVGWGKYQAKAHIALLQRARERAGRPDTPIYGFVTDTIDYVFIRIDPQGKMSTHTILLRPDFPDKVISLLWKIMQLAPDASRCSASPNGSS